MKNDRKDEEKELRDNFSRNISYLIRVSGKDQKDIALEIEVEPTTFNTWCVGKILPRLVYLQKLSAYFGVNVDALTSRDPISLAKRSVSLYPEEYEVLRAYQNADGTTKDIICKILNITREGGTLS